LDKGTASSGAQERCSVRVNRGEPTLPSLLIVLRLRSAKKAYAFNLITKQRFQVGKRIDSRLSLWNTIKLGFSNFIVFGTTKVVTSKKILQKEIGSS